MKLSIYFYFWVCSHAIDATLFFLCPSSGNLVDVLLFLFLFSSIHIVFLRNLLWLSIIRCGCGCVCRLAKDRSQLYALRKVPSKYIEAISKKLAKNFPQLQMSMLCAIPNIYVYIIYRGKKSDPMKSKRKKRRHESTVTFGKFAVEQLLGEMAIVC